VRPVSELAADGRSAWREIDAVIKAGPYPVKVLPPEVSRAASCLHGLQATAAVR
jgi:hypothetical protein